MVVLASIGLWTALLTHDFSLKYVASNTSANMPKVYVFAAFWGGQAGSMLFWALILSVYSAHRDLVVRGEGARSGAVGDAARSAVILLFFIATVCFKANPVRSPRASSRPTGAG